MEEKKILKTSKIKRKNLELINQNYNTLLIDDVYKTSVFEKNGNVFSLKDIKNIDTLILDKEFINLFHTNCYKRIDFYVHSNIKNIFLSDPKNLEGITIDYDFIKYKDSAVWIHFTEHINNLNLICGNLQKVILLEDSIDYIYIEKRELDLYVLIFTENFENIYYVTPNGEVKEEKNTYYIKKDKYKDKTLKLKDIQDYGKIEVCDNDLNLEKLIIDTSVIGNISFQKFKPFHIKELEIVEDNEMRLFPNIRDIEINSKISIGSSKDKILIIVFGDNDSISKIIEINKVCNEKVIYDKDNKDNFKDIKSVNYRHNNENYIVLIEHTKDNKLTLITDNNKIYHLNKLFDNFYKQNLSFFEKAQLSLSKSLKDIILEKYLSFLSKEFDTHYNNYKDYCSYLKQLNKNGISKNVLYYTALSSKIDSTFKNIKELIQCNDLTKEEINTINEFGKVIINRLKNNLPKSNNYIKEDEKEKTYQKEISHGSGFGKKLK